MQQRKYDYKNCKSKNGEFSCHVRHDINVLLDIYCKTNNLNKTLYVNDLIQADMERKFARLKERADNE